MTAGPQPLTLDCAALGCGLPNEALPLDQVRVLLLKRQTSWVSKDAVWHELVRRAHATPEPWTIVAAAMMMPGLKHIAGKLNSRFCGDRNDLDSEILEGFLQALDVTDARSPKIFGRLYWAAFRRGHEARDNERRRTMSRSELPDTALDSCTASGHPDLVLPGAMLSRVITPHEADLVSDVLLDHGDRSTAAKRRGMSRHQVAAQLTTASRHLADYLLGGPLRPAV
ncbi:hypothetical protein [Lentzea flava]|uniref:DNA-directed RNA polymerase specialized sigma subunit, sigma24 family n=1 Tax=Lentzea flava TaxID=103732 RepID=A0ABQ2VH69_9PSEU|nr:hypothetical protein [Lentzea flava]MCP2205417.1 hypothetical protein [Lentzea flava]GGU86505.1 hypothetical protein GCM10010178_90600 [Lentzea flava]